MLRNERNISKSKLLCYACCSCHNSKQARRTVKRGMKLRERRHWVSLEADNRHWSDAKVGEVWNLKMAGEWGLYVKLPIAHWKSLDHKWYIIEGDGDEAISAGNVTEVEVNVLEY